MRITNEFLLSKGFKKVPGKRSYTLPFVCSFIITETLNDDKTGTGYYLLLQGASVTVCVNPFIFYKTEDDISALLFGLTLTKERIIYPEEVCNE